MKPAPRNRRPPTKIEPHDNPDRHVMKFQEKVKSDLKLGNCKKKRKLAERKKVLRAEAAKKETDSEKDEKKKKETDRKRSWRMKKKSQAAPVSDKPATNVTKKKK